MRSWVFRNRRRLEALLGRTPAPPPADAVLPGPPASGAAGPLADGAHARESAPGRTRPPRVIVLEPARRAR